MQCIHDNKTARGICRFCGRALCEDHMKKNMPFIVTIYVGEKNTPKAIVVGDALWCGICKPQPEPIEMPEIF